MARSPKPARAGQAISLPRAVYIVDSDSRMRAATSFLLRGKGYETRVYDGGAEFLETHPVDGCVVVVKMYMRGLSGLEVQSRTIARGMTLPFIFLDGDVPLAVRAMRQGAVDVISLPYEPEVLIEAIEQAFHLADKDREKRHARAAAAARLDALSPRGLQVLQGLQAGMVNGEIARWLDLSPRTVEAHRAAMMVDIAATSLSQALHIAFEGGLVQLDTCVEDSALHLWRHLPIGPAGLNTEPI